MPPANPNRTPEQTRIIMIRIVLLSFILFFNSASTTYLYSFLPDMMVDFGLAKDKSESGRYGAWMASGFFLGRFLSATFWGIFIDKYGRKTGLLIVLVSVSTFTLLFGFSMNYYFALITRVLTGFLNGLSIIGKTLSTEICPDDLKPWSISVTNTIWALGMTVGPFIGSGFYRSITDYPYLGSAMSIALFGYLIAALSYKFFDETLQTAQPLSPVTNAIDPKKGFQKLDDSASDVVHDEETPQPVPTKRFAEMTRPEQLKYILKLPNVPKLIFIFSINTFYAAVIGELLPFWMAGKYVDGGLDFEHNSISKVYIWLTGPQLVLQIFLYPSLQKNRGDFWLLTMGHIIHIPMFFFIPYAHLFGQGAVASQTVWIIFWLFIRNLSSFMNFSALQRYTNDAISADKRGKLNGFQVTFSSCLQVAGPMLGGWVLSWSMTNGLFYPLNYHFVFLLMVIITVCVLAVIYKLDFTDATKQKLKGEASLTQSL